MCFKSSIDDYTTLVTHVHYNHSLMVNQLMLLMKYYHHQYCKWYQVGRHRQLRLFTCCTWSVQMWMCVTCLLAASGVSVQDEHFKALLPRSNESFLRNKNSFQDLMKKNWRNHY